MSQNTSWPLEGSREKNQSPVKDLIPSLSMNASTTQSPLTSTSSVQLNGMFAPLSSPPRRSVQHTIQQDIPHSASGYYFHHPQITSQEVRSIGHPMSLTPPVALAQPVPSGHRSDAASSNVVLSPAQLYGTTAKGEKYPLDLGPYVQQGLPMKMSKACSDKAIDFFAAKFPGGFDLSDLNPPLRIQRDVSQIEIAEEASMLVGSEETRPLEFRGRRDRDRKTRKIDPTQLPWRLTDKEKKSLTGRKTDLDTSNYFVMVEKGNCIELVPLNGWYTFHTDLHSDGTAETPSTDLVERRRRAALKMEEKAAARLASRVGKPESDSDHEHQPLKKARGSEGDPMDSLYAEDGGLKRQQKKKLKSILKQKKRGTKQDDEDVGDSALNLGELKRHEVDWDWEDDGKATDDEEDTGDHPSEDMDESKNDFAESDDAEQEVLTKFGRQVTSALETQREQDADDELAQFSDDEEDEETPSLMKEEEVDATMSPIGNGKKGPVEKDDVSTTWLAGTGKSTVGATKQIGGRSAPSTTKTTSIKSNGKEEPLSAESVKQRVIRLLSLQGGRMATKQFISTFNITSNKSDLFKFVRKSINEVCEVHTDTINGEQVKVLELLPQFRQT